MNSSSCVTLRLLVHPVDRHGTLQVSGRSRDGSGPEEPSRSRMSRRHASLARTQSRWDARQPGSSPRSARSQWAMSPRYSARSSLGRIIARSSSSVRSASAVSNSAGEYDDPRRLQATRSALGAIAAVGSTWSRVSWRTTSSSSVGRGRSKSCARTAMRRASRRESSWTVTTRGYRTGPTGSHLPIGARCRSRRCGRWLRSAPKVEMGALNPLTRHPVLVAMTVSAIDDMAPGRVILGMGTGLPLRLAQMGIPYSPGAGVEAVSRAIDTMRALWSGERVPPGAPGLPPVQPMFPPVHRVPVYIAAYRSAFLELAGRKADGYLARPAESVPSLRRMLVTLRAAAVAAGRPEDAGEVAGYLLTLVDRSRREALNRAKREPFVIYMMSVQSDLAMRRAGLDPELKDRVAAAWRAEDYHRAANLIPDELLDAFMLCGTREEVAAGAAAYHQAGMDLPLLQPVLQTEDQVREVLAAAVEYGRSAPARAAAPAAPVGPSAVDPSTAAAELSGAAMPAPAATGDLGGAARPELRRPWTARRLAAWFEIARPFSFTASTVPVAAGGALAALDGRLDWPLFVAALLAGVLLHVGTNITNEIYDVRKGIDSITSPRASHALLKGRLSEHEAFALAATAFAGSMAIGIWLVVERGWPVAVLGVLGLVGGLGYTAPPLEYKFHALGPPLMFLLMGPLMVVG